MCLLIHRSANAQPITDDWLDDFWNKNSDGFGAWWVDGTQLVIEKTLEKAQMVKIIREIEQGQFEAGLHFRMATHGAVDLENIHPFEIEGNNLIAHNGVMGDWTKYAGHRGKGLSDTVMFAKLGLEPFLKAFSVEYLYNEKSLEREIIDRIIGMGQNRLLFFNPDLGFTKLGNGSWTNWRGLSLSNTYAWSYNRRDHADGPKVSYAPFTGYYQRKGDSDNSNVSTFQDELPYVCMHKWLHWAVPFPPSPGWVVCGDAGGASKRIGPAAVAVKIKLMAIAGNLGCFPLYTTKDEDALIKDFLDLSDTAQTTWVVDNTKAAADLLESLVFSRSSWSTEGDDADVDYMSYVH